MTKPKVLLRKINSIQNCLKRIHDKTSNNINALDNVDVQDIVVLNLLRAVQLCVDIATHIVREKKLGLFDTLKEAFVILHKNNILDEALTESMCKMVGFRNIASHDYQVLNVDILKSIVQKNLGDFEKFYTVILNSEG